VHSSILYTCLLCGKSFKSLENYKLHMVKHNKDKPGVFTCIYQSCKQTFQNVDELQKQAKEANTSVIQLQCNECGNCFASKANLANHVKVHWDWQPFKCKTPGCSYSAKRSQDLLAHQNKVHTVNCFTCCHCGKMFKNRVCVYAHEKRHETDTPGVLKCLHRGCQETFSLPKDLMPHMKRHNMINECDVPGCLFTSKLMLDLRVHSRKVHSIWPHICQLCGKGFYLSADLRRHMQSHETEEEPGAIKFTKKMCKLPKAVFKKYFENFFKHNSSECQLCGKIIKSQKSVFQAHVLKHKTGTPGVLKCIFRGCKQTFTSATDLKQHTLQHWDLSLRPFACDFPRCIYASGNKSGLLEHKRNVHSSNLYTCDMCGKQFKHLSSIA
jgi:KRAB domain-containing zinc finger protein